MEAKVLKNLPKAELGEGPLWDSATQKLHWVDIVGFKVHRFDPKTKQHDQIETGSHVGFAVLNTEGKVVVGLKDGIYQMEFGKPGKTLLAQPSSLNPENRFNDGKVAPDGVLFAGTMNLNAGEDKKPTGSLYRLGSNGLTVVANDIHISNGIGWSPNQKTMYYTDTLRHEISQFDYDAKTGTASNRRTFVKIPTEEGYPDGLTVDSKGRVLTALWGGSRVNVYTPDGKLDDVIKVDVPQPSSVAFGGPDLKTLFITTARVDLSREQLEKQPLSGSLFAVEMPIPGQPSTRFSQMPTAAPAQG